MYIYEQVLYVILKQYRQTGCLFLNDKLINMETTKSIFHMQCAFSRISKKPANLYMAIKHISFLSFFKKMLYVHM